MTECIFCRIAQNEIPAEIIYETNHTVSFLDIRPRAIGHSLVIPKFHAIKLTELDSDIISEIFILTRDIAKILEKVLHPDAFTIGINDGKEAGQEIPHLHVNIIPRFIGDGGLAIHSVVYNPPSEDIHETAERIRAAT